MFTKTTRLAIQLVVMLDALARMGQKLLIKSVNGQAESLCGCDRDDTVGRPVKMLVPEALWRSCTPHSGREFATSGVAPVHWTRIC
jgi:hypothetical protein